MTTAIPRERATQTRLPFSIGSPKLLRRSNTSKTKRRAFVKKSHTRRNISILATLVVVVIIVIGLSGAFSPAPTYVMVVHVYDSTKGSPQTLYNFTDAMAIHNVTVTVSGPGYPETTRGPAPYGIVAWGPDDQLKAGSYQIKVSSSGYATYTETYVLGPNCFDKTPDEQCHPLVPMNPIA